MISILMPIYNGIEFLNESLQSVLNQTYTDWELIIGINGHEDPTPLVDHATVLKKNDDRIIVVSLSTKGKAESLNEMVKLASSEWIAILDVDDVWTPTKLEEQVQYIQSTADPNIAVVGTQCLYFGERAGSPDIPNGIINNPAYLIKQNPIINSSALIRKHLCKWSDTWGLDDYELWMKIMLQGYHFYNISSYLVYHRVYASSAFNSKPQPVSELRKWYSEQLRQKGVF
jgi:glycosyltransferase involved in cell wall biosynthesis